MTNPGNDPTNESPFAFDGLDRVIHEKARLGILSSLMAHSEGLLFAELKDLCGLTDGNLNRHLQVLQEARLIEVWKGNSGKRPQTLVRITSEGRGRFLDYIRLLEKIVGEARKAAGVEPPGVRRSRGGFGWSSS